MKAKLDLLFRAHDIRGVYREHFDDAFYEEFGRAFVAWLAKAKRAARPRLFVAQDVRPTSPKLTRRLIKGLVESGAHVTDVGVVPTPVLYYLVWNNRRTGGVQVTASHNPPEWNGIKPAWNRLVLSPEEQGEVRRAYEAGVFRTGKGSLAKKRVEGEYLRHATKGLRCARRLRVVVDAGNGTCGPLGLRLVRKMGAQAVPLHCDPDPRFPNHLADPLKPENIRDLQERVVAEGADLGIAFDGDGDRVAFVDDRGGAMSCDEALILFMRDAAAGWRARKPPVVLYTILMSNAIADEAKRLKLKTHVTPVGHTIIQHLMKTHGGLMAAETSGHFFFRDAGGFDDGLHTAARFLHLASRLDRPLSEVRRAIPGYWSTRSFYIPCPDERKASVMAAVKASLGKSYNTLTLDGVRVELLRSWGLIRPSGTKPELNFRFEGESLADLTEAYRIFERELARYKLKLPPLETLVVKPLR